MLFGIFFLRWWLKKENRKKDALLQIEMPEAGDPHMIHAFEDRTDRENVNFRYVF
jgi:hypothetical protein